MYILLVETTYLHPLVETYFVFSSSSLWCDVICDCPHRKGKLLVEVTDFSLPSFFCITFSLPIITSYTHSTLIFDRSTKATSTLKTMYFCRTGYFLKIFSNYNSKKKVTFFVKNSVDLADKQKQKDCNLKIQYCPNISMFLRNRDCFFLRRSNVHWICNLLHADISYKPFYFQKKNFQGQLSIFKESLVKS